MEYNCHISDLVFAFFDGNGELNLLLQHAKPPTYTTLIYTSIQDSTLKNINCQFDYNWIPAVMKSCDNRYTLLLKWEQHISVNYMFRTFSA